jgi:hypothetical protein
VFAIFLAFTNIRRSNSVIMNLNVVYDTRLRNLEERVVPSICTLDDADRNKYDGLCKYNCDAPKDSNIRVNEVSVVNVTFPNTSLTMDDINYSEEAALAAAQVNKQTDSISEYLVLQNGALNIRDKYFIINGEIEGYDGNVGDSGLILRVINNNTNPKTPQEVPCTIQSKNNNNYQFRCTPQNNVTGSIFLQPLKDNDKAITLNMTQNNDYINFITGGGNTTIENREVGIYRKSSSNLSGGAIAGIVIACVVALIVASIIAIMMRKSAVPPPVQPQSASIVGLRSVDNYSQ